MNKFRKHFLFFSVIFLFLAINLCANPLPADEAFKLTVSRTGSSIIQAKWDIAQHYHLYKSEISIALAENNGTVLGKIDYPPGIPQHSDVLGSYDVYENTLSVNIPVEKWGKGQTQLVFNYQGCKDDSACYPPITKVISIDPPSQSAVSAVSSPTLSSTEQLLASGNILLILFSFFIFGIFLSLTPCVLPMIPILVGIIMGQKNLKTSKALLLSLSYVLGIAITYAAAGVVTAMLGSSIQSILQNFWVIMFCGLIFVLLALSLFGLYELQLPSSLMTKLNKASLQQKQGSYIGTFLMGAISSLIVSPCVSAPLAGALIYIATTGDIFLGGAALFFLALGMGVLLVIAGVTGGKLFLKTGKWMVTIRYFIGVMMLAMAIWLVSRVIPDFITYLMWAILMIGTGYYAGAFEPGRDDSAGIKFRKLIAFLVLLSGVAFGLMTFIGHIGLINPIKSMEYQAVSAPSDDSLFSAVTNLSEMEDLIRKAIKENKPIMIDYYADWCTSCREMDGTTFKNPDVRYALKQFMAIRADITKNDSASRELKAKYKVFAPPYFIFLDNKGNQLKDSTLAGEINANDLLAQLNIISSVYGSN